MTTKLDQTTVVKEVKKAVKPTTYFCVAVDPSGQYAAFEKSEGSDFQGSRWSFVCDASSYEEAELLAQEYEQQ